MTFRERIDRLLKKYPPEAPPLTCRWGYTDEDFAGWVLEDDPESHERTQRIYYNGTHVGSATMYGTYYFANSFSDHPEAKRKVEAFAWRHFKKKQDEYEDWCREVEYKDRKRVREAEKALGIEK